MTMIEPAFRSLPEHDDMSVAEDGIALAELVNFRLDPEQELLMRATFARRGDRWAAFEVGCICCRQNLKTGWLKIAALTDLWLTPAKLIVWTAHLFPTASEAFRDILALIESCPELERDVKRVSQANGEEGIELKDESRLLFKARSKGGGRGFTGDVVIFDEGFALEPGHVGALLPTLSARPDPQVRYASSAGMAHSAVLREVRDRGRLGGSKTLAYCEWCAPEGQCALESCDHSRGRDGCSMDDPAMWQLGNPAMDRRISREFIAAERAAMPAEEFARERMGWWDDPDTTLTQGLTREAWDSCADPESRRAGRVAFAVEVRLDRSTADIAVVGRREDGLLHGELAASGRGTSWVADWLAERVAAHDPVAVVVDPGGPAGSLIPELEAAGLDLTLVTGPEYARACGALYDSVTQGQFRHIGQEQLGAAVESAAVKVLSRDAWVWRPVSPLSSISLLKALTLALHGFTAEPDYDVLDSVY